MVSHLIVIQAGLRVHAAAQSIALAASTALSLAILMVAPARAQPVAELHVAENQFPTSLDADVGFAGYSLMSYGVAESLMRITPDMRVAPWLAASLDQVDDLTWRATIRDGVTFWDGTRVDAAAVKASLERSLDKQPGAASLLPTGTTLAAEGQILTIGLPTPVGSLPNNLAAYSLTVKKLDADGNPIYTGPFSYQDWIAQQSIMLNANPRYWGGNPSVSTIYVRFIPDVTARVLAIEAGDVDIAHALLPSDIAPLQAAGFHVYNFPFGRQDDMLLNVNHAPLNDVDVRRALALAIDRDALVAGVMNGVGTPAVGFAPDNIGLAGVIPAQQYDPAQARSVLDAAGWAPSDGGIRTKNGERLAFKLGAYASRAELAPLTVAIKDQLRAVGIDVTLETFSDINTSVATNAFDATLYSYGVAPFGDLGGAVGLLYTPSGTNKDRYGNPRVNDLFAQYGQTADMGQRQALLTTMQTLVGQDVPVVYLVNPNQIVATSTRVTGYTPHPLENYKIDIGLGIQP
jgi:peptide/nickel transport system substrate-binding protein